MRRITLWFILAVLVQLAILAVLPARKVYALMTGTRVFLKVAPVDPYSIMSGHYMSLSYDVSRPGDGRRRGTASPQNTPLLQSWEDLKDNKKVYVILQAGPSGLWEAQAVHTSRPKNLAPGEVPIRGRKTRRGIKYGLETFYFPEAVRERINDDLRSHPNDASVEVKVDAFGNATLVRLMIQDRVYE